MDYLEYKGYKGSVEYSKEDNCLFGKVQGMSKALILYEGDTLEELRKDFENGVDSYLEACKADGVENYVRILRMVLTAISKLVKLMGLSLLCHTKVWLYMFNQGPLRVCPRYHKPCSGFYLILPP